MTPNTNTTEYRRPTEEQPYFDSEKAAETLLLEDFQQEPRPNEITVRVMVGDKVEELHARYREASDIFPKGYVVLNDYSIADELPSSNGVRSDREIIGRDTYADVPVYMPKVGDGGTVSVGTDRYPVTVVDVEREGKWVTVQDDGAEAAEGHNYYGSQKWKFYRNPFGSTQKFSIRRDGTYRPFGSRSPHSYRLHLSGRDKYSDPHF